MGLSSDTVILSVLVYRWAGVLINVPFSLYRNHLIEEKRWNYLQNYIEESKGFLIVPEGSSLYQKGLGVLRTRVWPRFLLGIVCETTPLIWMLCSRICSVNPGVRTAILSVLIYRWMSILMSLPFSLYANHLIKEDQWSTFISHMQESQEEMRERPNHWA
mmetsp:Transcript_11132/g.20202  ORF Transcript_11132/g.20202 Transcript_11132/m.20202 type:complete len:160 (-) Transcript_11132:62-541(-)